MSEPTRAEVLSQAFSVWLTNLPIEQIIDGSDYSLAEDAGRALDAALTAWELSQ